jgi:hypothetical protein
MLAGISSHGSLPYSQAEHLNLLLGSGFTTAIGSVAGVATTGMAKVTFGTPHDAAIDAHAQAAATAMKRGTANIEDQFRSALALLDGLGVIDKGAEKILKDGIDAQMSGFLTSLLKTESDIVAGKDLASRNTAQGVLQSFLLSFASRAASRERLHVFPSARPRQWQRVSIASLHRFRNAAASSRPRAVRRRPC